MEMGRSCLACKYRRKLSVGAEKDIVDSDDYSEFYKTDISD